MRRQLIKCDVSPASTLFHNEHIVSPASTRDRRDSDGWHTVIHGESLIPAIRDAVHGNDFATFRTLMKDFVDDLEHKSCHCLRYVANGYDINEEDKRNFDYFIGMF